MSFKYTRKFDDVLRQIEKEDRRLIGSASRHLRGRMARKINHRSRYSKGKNIPDGQAPGYVTKNLLRGLVAVTKRTVGIVGFLAPAYHALLMEFGTSYMAPHPILYPTIAEELETLKRILSGQRVK